MTKYTKPYVNLRHRLLLDWRPSNLRLTSWYRADLGIIEDGATRVKTWQDQMGNYDLTGHGASEPDNLPQVQTANFNGHDSIKFITASAQYFEYTAGDQVIAPDTEVWVVLRYNDLSASMAIIDCQDTILGAHIYHEVSSPGSIVQYTVGSSGNSGGTISVDTIAYAAAHYTGTDSISINNGTPATSAMPAVSGAGLRVGRRGGGGTVYLSGEIAEIIIAPEKIEGNDRIRLISYLNERYGV